MSSSVHFTIRELCVYTFNHLRLRGAQRTRLWGLLRKKTLPKTTLFELAEICGSRTVVVDLARRMVRDKEARGVRSEERRSFEDQAVHTLLSLSRR